MSAPQRQEVMLPGCQLTCEVAPESWPLDELCSFAVRRNERRRFLFVSKVLGRHWPTPPAALRRVADALARKLMEQPLAMPVLFIGMAETATTLAQAVFRAWCELARPAPGTAYYLDTTRRRTGGAIAFHFSEDHSHASAHLVHAPCTYSDPHSVFRQARSLVIVDDEATTGRTAANLARAYAGWRGISLDELDTHLAVLARWRRDGVDSSTPEVRHLHSLLNGSFTFQHTNEAFPEAPAQQTHPDRGMPAPRGTRHGISIPESLPRRVRDQAAQEARLGARHLVLGAGEFGFAPLLWAEALEAAGAEVCLQAVTRSPILQGGAIGHVRSFPSHGGEEHTEYLYNVPEDHGWDVVWLCREDTFPLPPDHPLWRIPRLREAPHLRPVENEAPKNA